MIPLEVGGKTRKPPLSLHLVQDSAFNLALQVDLPQQELARRLLVILPDSAADYRLISSGNT